MTVWGQPVEEFVYCKMQRVVKPLTPAGFVTIYDRRPNVPKLTARCWNSYMAIA